MILSSTMEEEILNQPYISVSQTDSGTKSSELDSWKEKNGIKRNNNNNNNNKELTFNL